MPDITMCPSETCPVRVQCRRNPMSGTKPSEFRQSWFAVIYEEPCDHYWPVKELVK